MPDGKLTKEELYARGVALSTAFLQHNNLPLPEFLTYQQATGKAAEKLGRFQRLMPIQGALTGYYESKRVFVNVPVTAHMVMKPAVTNWSYPGYRIDRTACGVVAHEVGHYIEHILQEKGVYTKEHGEFWRDLIKHSKKQVSGYEKGRPFSESFAESIRLFILNPKLLFEGLPNRWLFIANHLNPSESRDWQTVLNHHPTYIAQAEKWIEKKEFV